MNIGAKVGDTVIARRAFGVKIIGRVESVTESGCFYAGGKEYKADGTNRSKGREPVFIATPKDIADAEASLARNRLRRRFTNASIAAMTDDQIALIFAMLDEPKAEVKP